MKRPPNPILKKSALLLTKAEAAMVAACLPNPKTYTVKPLSNYVARRTPWVMQQMNNLESDPDIQKIISNTNAKEKK